MRRLILLIIALATLLPSLAFGYDVLVLQSRHDQIYQSVLKGFQSGRNATIRTIVLSDYAEVDVARIAREDRPRLILAIGDAALSATRNIRNTPIVAVMALGIHSRKAAQDNLTGIGVFAQPESYIDTFKKMNARRVGVVYNQSKSGWYIKLARQAAEAAGIELVTREVSVSHESIGQLATLVGKVDALWMLPDSIAVTKESTEEYFRFGQYNSVPVVSFAASYLGIGAAAVIEIDHEKLGKQAAEMVGNILNGNRQPVHFPTATKIKTNSSVLNRLKLKL